MTCIFLLTPSTMQAHYLSPKESLHKLENYSTDDLLPNQMWAQPQTCLSGTASITTTPADFAPLRGSTFKHQCPIWALMPKHQCPITQSTSITNDKPTPSPKEHVRPHAPFDRPNPSSMPRNPASSCFHQDGTPR